MPIFIVLFTIALLFPVLYPYIDVMASGLFYRPEDGFFWADQSLFITLHWVAYYGARVLGVGFAFLCALAWLRRHAVFNLNAKAWLFLLVALLIGPVLIANICLKDHWGRARPRDISEFGGSQSFTPALEPHFERARSNGSFVSGDGAFGFFLPSFAYIVPRRKSRKVFWGTMGAGILFSFARLVMGAHFLSDIIYAAFFMLLSSAIIYGTMYGQQEVIMCWREWFKRPTKF
jgi:lipid A 4'-phosphatase